MARLAKFFIISIFIFNNCAKEGKKEDGEKCKENYECKSSICYINKCINGDDDNDGDGILNKDEIKISLNPSSSDSDNDGINDKEEIGFDINNPIDTDGDKKIDALESAINDTDNDCISDQFDPDDLNKTDDKNLLIKYGCKPKGVCEEMKDFIKVLCSEKNGEKLLKCDYSSIPLYFEKDFLCDGKDNDCDGLIDENVFYQNIPVGEACKGEGECGIGIVECNPLTLEGMCSSEPFGSNDNSKEEICDFIDNNCDGKTDEIFHIGEKCTGKGVCTEGKFECSMKTKKAQCSTQPQGSEDKSTAEVCDSLDNDCDGETDEDILIPPPPSVCKIKGVCADGISFISVKCEKGKLFCGYENVPNYEGEKETSCDGLDNDCDGLIDEDFLYYEGGKQPKKLGESCGTGECEGGVVLCADNKKELTCSSFLKKKEEVCDEIDNNCDGNTDEGVQKKWKNEFKTLTEGFPPPRLDTAIAISQEDKKLLLFGGAGLVGGGKTLFLHNDTWIYDLEEQKWFEIFPSTLPSARERANLHYDPSGKRFILYGGRGITQDGKVENLNDLWAFYLPDKWEKIQTLNPLNIEGAESSICVSCHYLYIYGVDEKTQTPVFKELDLTSFQWNSLPSPPQGLKYSSLAVDENSLILYLFGGIKNDGTPSDDFWLFDIEKGQWEIIPSLNKPAERWAHSMEFDHNFSRIILFGGIGKENIPLGDTWIYDKKNKVWSLQSLFPSPLEAGFSGFRIFKKEGILVQGAWKKDSQIEIWRLALENLGWKKEISSNLPLPLAGGVSIFSKEKGEWFIIGGYKSSVWGSIPLLSIWSYSFKEKEWNLFDVTLENPFIFGSGAINESNGKIYLYGGYKGVIGEDYKGLVESDKLILFETQKKIISEINPLGDIPPPITGHSMVFSKKFEKIFLFGGVSGFKPLNDIYIFNPQTNIWEKAQKKSLWPDGISGHRMFIDESSDEIIVAGGGGSGGNIWKLNLNNMEWKKILSHSSLDKYEPFCMFDPYSNQILTMEIKDGKPYFYNFLLNEGSVTQIDFKNPPLIFNSPQIIFETSQRVGYIFGGIDQQGNTRQTFLSLEQTCN